jgi:type II secretory pathway component PulF
MLESGLPVVEAVSTIAGSRSASAARTMLVELREHLREGAALDECLAAHPAWFDEAETAMVRAARESGELPRVLRSLAERHERSGALAAKLVAALTYPAVVCCVGLGVVVFLSVKTLPDLVAILADAGIDPPRLTTGIMAFGQAIASHGPLLALAAVALALPAAALAPRLRPAGWSAPPGLRRLLPRAIRQTLIARAWSNLAELVATGVPLVDSLRIVAPTVGGAGAGSLARSLRDAAGAIERGSTLADALRDPVWFDDECRRLVAIGESAGELPDILTRLAHRTHRAAARSIDRFAALLEPAVILLLASAIGVVVIGAVLPILKLQEVIG